jgi:hypothetical protein
VPALTAVRLLSPLDELRRRALLALGPLGPPLIRDRDLRVAAAAVFAVLFALLTTAVAPLWAMALGPVLLGVPHLVSDVRYLVVKPAVHRRRLLAICAGIPLACAAANLGMQAGLVACAAVLVLADTTPVRRISGLAVVAALAWAAVLAGDTADLIFAHAHNFIAVAFFWMWRPRGRKLHAVPLALFVLASAAIAWGALDAAWDLADRWAPEGLGTGERLASFAPDLDGPLAPRLVLLFAFAQSVHYGVWLRLVPEEARDRATPRSFSATFRALRSDFTALGLAACALLALGIACWAVFDLVSAYDGYLRLALFHGHLELAALALLWAEGRAALLPRAKEVRTT